ncbi:6702_t:CDS:2 [Racocetra persica]|uniref:6702_t:CDS:1 n=1 Tax=Racocetra persica TaxID=160502 RepID=A0ACA9KMS7_9GLOM|nr:6702_t:CDS:2 [Racocetra persica]
MLAQTKLKEELIWLNQELSQLHDLEDRDGQLKPIVLMISDSGSDENSRYKKTIQVMIDASNPVERQMEPLSYDLAKIILPYDIFGSHLDKQLKIADEKLEKRNFKAAGEILAFVLENITINGYPILVEYVDPEKSYQLRLDEKSATWIERYTITCRYIIQIIKYNNTSCCRPFCSRILQLLPN